MALPPSLLSGQFYGVSQARRLSRVYKEGGSARIVKQWIRYGLIGLGAMAILVLLVNLLEPEYAYVPSLRKVANPVRGNQEQAYDLWGQSISHEEAARLMQTEKGRAMLDPHGGAVPTDQRMQALGREAFYAETFGNEVFFSDVMGVLSGPLGPWDFVKAVIKLGGRGTDNLQVTASKTVTVGGKTIKKGDVIDTGFDVPKGAFMPLGVRAKFADNRVKIGFTCALCHATVDPKSGKVLEGVTNQNFNVGPLMAFGTNTASYFTHAELKALDHFVKHGTQRMVTTTTGEQAPLPDPELLEAQVDATLMGWPPGSFDTANDFIDNPVKVPHTFTQGVHPYSWSGFGMAGPFKGLSALNNNVHSKSADTTTQAPTAGPLYGIDEEVYIGTVLQNSANPQYRYDPSSGLKPSEFLAKVDPTKLSQGVGLSHVTPPPNFPKSSLLTTISAFASRPGRPVWEQINAMSVFQNSLLPPPVERQADPEMVAQGRAVFTQAGCATCHAGPKGTNHRIVPTGVVQTEPTRAMALKATQKNWGDPLIWSFDTPVPVPPDAKVLQVPTGHLDPEQVALAMGWVGQGGYKVKDLVAVRLHAPYLHDGGVAVGPDLQTQVGVANSIMQGIPADPANSLRALIDRKLRARVLAANRRAGILSGSYVRGQGHPFYVDQEAGFSQRDQDALIEYLLSLP